MDSLFVDVRGFVHVGAGGGTLYGIYDNRQHDERYRNAYAGCMKSKGYTG